MYLDTVKMTTQQTVWPCFPFIFPLTCPMTGRVYHQGVRTSPTVIPYIYNAVIEIPHPKDKRQFLLERSVFNLVDDHGYLSLTDPKLLGWYLCLSPEDRKIIQDEGGFHQFLQRHPALKLTKHHVHIKYNADGNCPAQWTATSNMHRSTAPAASRTYEIHQEDGFQKAINTLVTKVPSPHQRAQELREEEPGTYMARSSSSVAMCKDPAVLRSFSSDRQLDSCRWTGQHECRSQISEAQGQTSDFPFPEISLLQSEWPTVGKEPQSEYYVLDGINVAGTCYDDKSIIPPMKQEEEDSLMFVPGVEDTPSNNSHDSEYLMDGGQAELSVDGEGDSFHSIMADDKSIICLAKDGQKAHASVGHSYSATRNSEAPIITTSTSRPAPTCDAMTSTELTERMSAFTQTEDPATADKHIITEVHMADLDYLTEEFIKLKTAQELRDGKETMKRAGCKLRKECDCARRAQQAELWVLALQYNVWRQHCWRLHHTFAEGAILLGDVETYWPKDPPANLVAVLQKLESDYNHKRNEILAGVPLEDLKPLAVDPNKIISASTYSPIVGDVLENVPSRTSQQSLKSKTSGEGTGCLDGQNTRQSLKKEGLTSQVRKDGSKTRQAVALVPQERGAIYKTYQPEKIQTSSFKDSNMNEVWYDAEEDLDPAAAGVAAEMREQSKESTCEEPKGSRLCGSDLPGNVTETPPLVSSAKTRKVVCITPTAKGTCVPQHYGTMGSFDTLMSELAERHPDVGRPRILDALIELRAKHQDVLSGLPLRTIRQMMSDILTRPANTTQL